ncbi:hypothetical protein [Amycolatopsis minnesotensis]|uniref:Uncharacterized protein n=1 Tax=Amycolatopsis minnesotensis TaxID=337894 RepID=A0ABP5BMT4_9PSEU
MDPRMPVMDGPTRCARRLPPSVAAVLATVKTHPLNIYGKLGVGDRCQPRTAARHSS